MKLEETLNGGYNGLYGEVVTYDIYRLKKIPFKPDIIFDFGANIGVFTRYARTLFHDALIVSVEPHPDNIKLFKEFTNDKNNILIEKAIGRGKMWHNLGAVNGSGESYVSSGLGFENEMMRNAVDNSLGIEDSMIKCAMPDEIISQYWKQGMKAILKVDIEGGENIIYGHQSSMDIIKQIDYITMEVHWYALTGGLAYDEVKAATLRAIEELKETHTTELDNVTFWALKKEYESR
jgi:FkbM family methyltransferase